MDEAQLAEEWKTLNQERAALVLAKEAFELEKSSSDVEVKLFVGNLDPDTDDAAVKAMFEEFGVVKEVHVLTDREGKSKRSCFVKFYSDQHAKKAISALDGKRTDGSARDPLAVRVANPRAPIAGAPGAGAGRMPGMMQAWQQQQQPQAATAYDPYPAQANPYGAPAQYGSQPSPYGAQQPNPYAQQPDPYAQQQGFAQQGAPQPHAFPAAGGPPQAVGAGMGSGRGPEGANLYVNNLQSGTSQQDLQAMFGDFGKVVSIKLFSTGRELMYGFVSFDNAASGQAAISALDGMDLGNNRGRQLEVRLKTDKGSARGNRFTPY